MRHPFGALAGLLLVALLASRLPGAPRAAILFSLFFALGLGVAASRSAPSARFPSDRFVTVAAPLGRGWEKSRGRVRVDADEFAVNGTRVRAPLSIYLATDPPGTGAAARVVAEGFLTRSERGAYALSVKSSRLVTHEGSLSLLHPTRWNRAIARKLRAIGAEEPRGVALAEALALGRSERLPDDIRESYRRGGTYHLLVFSGMQIAIAAGFFVGIFRLLGLPRVGDFVLLALAAIAPLFAGNEPSVSRASWMIGLYAFSRILHRPTTTENLLFVSALLRLVAHPEELTDPGFALTYAATGGLILIGKPLAESCGARLKLARDFLYGLGAEMATTPLTLLFFHQYVAGSSIVTILLAPILLAMLALSFFAAIGSCISAAATLAALRAIAFLDGVAVAMNGFFADSVRLCGLAAAPPAIAVAAPAILILAIHATRVRARTALFVAIAGLAIPLAGAVARNVGSTATNPPAIEILDVGQGDAILLRQDRDAILVDGGGRTWHPSFGRSVLVPMLLDRRIRRLSAVALSHPDPDHCGGLAAVLENLEVGELWVSSRHFENDCTATLLDAARRRGVAIRLTNYCRRLSAGPIRVEAIAPRLRFKRSPVNNSSIVFRATLAGRRILLTGDIERDAERLLAEEHAPALRAEILKVAHHGSRSSSTSPLLAAVAPRIAVISCGRGNAFGHPHPEVLETLGKREIRIWRTDRHGSIRIEMGRALRVTTER